jgi:lipopolysaccharide/colanic/teichoic acid biosynthesis glycosyltransferase
MILKRTFDIGASLVLLVLLLPILLVIGIFIRIKMPDGPVLFSQKRVGKDAGSFIMFKFRTMTVNHGGSTITVKGESRITPLGAFLRKYKLDELPELYNVLRGDMSFVGPRPDVPGYADKLQGEDRLILNLRPGLTSPASLKYANEEEILAQQDDPVKYNDEVIYPEKIRMNLDYYKNRNFLLDLKIILYTVLGKQLKETNKTSQNV